MPITTQLSKQKYNPNSERSCLQHEDVPLSAAQIKMLWMSQADIAQGRLISEDELIKQDKQWLY